MNVTATEIAGLPCIIVATDTPLSAASAASALVEAAMNEGARVVVVPVEHLGDAFFQLRTGLAGEIVQKLVQYRMKLAVVGDVSHYVAASMAFRDLVIESERGSDFIFVSDMDALAARLAAGKRA